MPSVQIVSDRSAFRLLPFGISRLIYTNRSQSELASEVMVMVAAALSVVDVTSVLDQNVHDRWEPSE